MIGLDTNVIVRFLVQDDRDQARRATEVINGLTPANPGYIASVVWAETYWVLTRAYGFSRSQVLDRLADLSLADEIRCEDAVSVSAALRAARRGADFPDALIDAAAAHAGCTATVTFDRRAADRVGWQLV